MYYILVARRYPDAAVRKMRKFKIRSNILLFAIGIVFLVAVFSYAPCVAYAELPPNYVESVQEAGSEWWSELLALDEVKTAVDGWFAPGNEMYDFSRLAVEPIVVAVIDSGINVGHEIFTGDYGEAEKYDVLYRKSNGDLICKNTVNDSENVADVSSGGHGTHVAGIIATLIHRLGLEKFIKIMPIMAGTYASNGGANFTVTDVKEGIRFALSNGADVINLSLESRDDDFNFVSEEWASKAVFVAAAGNGGTALIKYYPAADEQVIGVMNISDELDDEGNLQLSASSNFGDAYAICAPGANIYSAGLKGNEYISKSGTSMAAPIVSFASALALLKYRAIEEATGIARSVDEVREVVKFSSTSYIKKNNSQLAVLNLRKLVASDDSVLAKVDIAPEFERQQLGDIKEIPLSLKVLPEELAGQGTVEWMLNDPDGEKIGEGFEFVFTPLNERGKQIVYARWTVETDLGVKTVVVRHTITVEYARLTSQTLAEIKIGVLGEDGKTLRDVRFEEGKEYVVTFDGADNYDPDVSEDFKWVINGVLVGTGKQVSFTPSEAGEYEIYVGVGQKKSPIRIISFSIAQGPSQKEIIEYVSFAVVGAVAVAIVVLVILRILGISRAKKRK